MNMNLNSLSNLCAHTLTSGVAVVGYSISNLTKLTPISNHSHSKIENDYQEMNNSIRRPSFKDSLTEEEEQEFLRDPFNFAPQSDAVVNNYYAKHKDDYKPRSLNLNNSSRTLWHGQDANGDAEGKSKSSLTEDDIKGGFISPPDLSKLELPSALKNASTAEISQYLGEHPHSEIAKEIQRELLPYLSMRNFDHPFSKTEYDPYSKLYRTTPDEDYFLSLFNRMNTVLLDNGTGITYGASLANQLADVFLPDWASKIKNAFIPAQLENALIGASGIYAYKVIERLAINSIYAQAKQESDVFVMAPEKQKLMNKLLLKDGIFNEFDLAIHGERLEDIFRGGIDNLTENINALRNGYDGVENMTSISNKMGHGTEADINTFYKIVMHELNNTNSAFYKDMKSNHLDSDIREYLTQLESNSSSNDRAIAIHDLATGHKAMYLDSGTSKYFMSLNNIGPTGFAGQLLNKYKNAGNSMLPTQLFWDEEHGKFVTSNVYDEYERFMNIRSGKDTIDNFIDVSEKIQNVSKIADVINALGKDSPIKQTYNMIKKAYPQIDTAAKAISFIGNFFKNYAINGRILSKNLHDDFPKPSLEGFDERDWEFWIR